YGDVDLSSIADVPYGQMANFPLLYPSDKSLIALITDAHFGSICTNDKFISKVEDAAAIINHFPKEINILCFDMESAAYAQSCYFYNLPFLAIRAISDVIGEDNFYDHVGEACLQSNHFLLNLLKKF